MNDIYDIRNPRGNALARMICEIEGTSDVLNVTLQGRPVAVILDAGYYAELRDLVERPTGRGALHIATHADGNSETCDCGAGRNHDAAPISHAHAVDRALATERFVRRDENGLVIEPGSDPLA